MGSGRVYGGHWLTEEQKKLVEDNISYAYYAINSYINRGIIPYYDSDEAGGYMLFDFCLAAERFKPEIGNVFITYAKKGLHSGFLRYLELKQRHKKRFVNFDFKDANSYETQKQFFNINYISLKRYSNTRWEDLEILFEESGMDHREQRVVRSYYKERYNFREIGKQIGLTKERIRQIHKEAISKMQAIIEDKDYEIKDFLATSKSLF